MEGLLSEISGVSVLSIGADIVRLRINTIANTALSPAASLSAGCKSILHGSAYKLTISCLKRCCMVCKSMHVVTRRGRLLHCHSGSFYSQPAAETDHAACGRGNIGLDKIRVQVRTVMSKTGMHILLRLLWHPNAWSHECMDRPVPISCIIMCIARPINKSCMCGHHRSEERAAVGGRPLAGGTHELQQRAIAKC